MYSEGLFEINGVSLFCKIRGEGSPILFIHGAVVDGNFFDETAEILAKNHKVITYDRRGYSRSGGKIENGFLEDSAKDAAEIIRRFSPEEKVTVIGCSAGALVAMKLTNVYPELISEAIFFEPPSFAYLEEGHWAFEVADKINDFVAAGKIGRGATKFLLLMEGGDENAKPKTEEAMIREEKNMRYFIEYEFAATFTRELPPAVPENIPAVFCAGDAHRTDFLYKNAMMLAKGFERPFVRIAGMHNCANDLPMEFAAAMEGIIKTI